MHVPSTIYVAKFDDRAVVLDSRNSRYVALKDGIAQALIWVSGGCTEGTYTPDQNDLSRLLKHGFIDAGGKHSKPSPVIQAESEIFASASGATKCAQAVIKRRTWEAIYDLNRAHRALNLPTLSQVLDWINGRKDGLIGCSSDTDLQSAVDSFYLARPFFPVKPVCRLDAIALFLFLRRQNIDALFVIGVRLDPFVAHSWVQVGDITIGEPHDRIRQFAPVLSV